jgi:hypothetical protein
MPTTTIVLLVLIIRQGELQQPADRIPIVVTLIALEIIPF